MDEGLTKETIEGGIIYSVSFLPYRKIWQLNGKRHRLLGPAVESNLGTNLWYQNGLLHRIGAPAAEYFTGLTEWWVEGKRHREDGPAIITPSGSFEWWLHGHKIPCTTQEQFERLCKLKLFW